MNQQPTTLPKFIQINNTSEVTATFLKNPNINCLVIPPSKTNSRQIRIYRGVDINKGCNNQINPDYRGFLRKLDEQAKEKENNTDTDTDIIEGEFEKIPKTLIEKVTGRGRGRPRINRAPIDFPKIFTVPELAVQLNISPANVAAEIVRRKKEGDKFDVIEKIKHKSGRGKPTNRLKFTPRDEKESVKVKTEPKAKIEVIKVGKKVKIKLTPKPTNKTMKKVNVRAAKLKIKIAPKQKSRVVKKKTVIKTKNK